MLNSPSLVYNTALAKAMLSFVIIILIAVVVFAAAATTILYLSNFGQNDIFSNILDGAASFLEGPLHTTAQDQYLKTTISVKNTTIVADLALTPDQQTKGLSGRDRLGENQAMLFVFKTPGNYGFWMKEMRFPLDIFWLDANRSVVHIKQNLQPCPSILNCPTYFPDEDSLYVLETIAGFAQKHNISNGTHFNFRLST